MSHLPRIPDAAAEGALIAAAQNGDHAATEQLLAAYDNAARAAANRFGSTLDAEDALQTARLGILTAIAAYDPAKYDRLAAIVIGYMLEELTGAASSAGHIQIPARTLTRYWAILRACDGDVNRSSISAQEHGMTRETFSAIHAAVTREELPLGLAEPADTNDLYDSIDDQVMSRQALGAMDDTQRRVVRLAYAFDSYRPLSDGEISEEVEMSRSAVQRARTSGLDAARKSLGISE